MDLVESVPVEASPEIIPRVERVAAPVVRRASSLLVGAVDDPAERHADELADAVLSKISAVPSTRVRRAAAVVRREPAADITNGVGQGVGQGVDPDEIDLDGEPDQATTDQLAPDQSTTDQATPDSNGGGSDTVARFPLANMADPAPSARIRRSPSPRSGAPTVPARPANRVQRAALATPASTPASTLAAAAPGHGAAGGSVEPRTEARIQRSQGRGSALDDATRSRMESGFGTDLADVKVHRDSEAADLSRSLNARAFTVGRDIYFGGGEYRPGSSSGDRLLAHELAHAVTDSGGAHRSVRRRLVIRRRFRPAVVASKAHLRQKDAWGPFHGSEIAANSMILVDDSEATKVVQRRTLAPNVTWRPAVNALPTTRAPVPGTQQGYIRSSRALFTPRQLRRTYFDEISTILGTAEQRMPNGDLTGELAKADHVDFLIDKALRYDNWNGNDPAVSVFVSGLASLQPKLDRIREGAEHVADTLEYWRKWLHPTEEDQVSVLSVKFLKSDLHEHGLGVLDVKFSKPLGGNPKFANNAIVETIIKPEDKSLEQALLGAEPTSVANQVNQLAGLTGNAKLGTIKMEAANTAPNGAEPVFSTLVEKIKGTSSEDLVGGDKAKKSKGAFAVTPSFYETLVFSFLIGMDDLHWENVMWINGTPYLIDADAAMMHAQMTKTSTGDANQSGFSTVNQAEATESLQGIKANDPARARSDVLDMMVNDPVSRQTVIDAIESALDGKKGRTVPIFTDRWKFLLLEYQKAPDQGAFLDFYASRDSIVRQNKPLDSKIGPGLAGTTGVNLVTPVWNAAAERAQVKADFDAGSIPFYEYDYTSGAVSHNGDHIFNGLTLDDAMTLLAARF